MKFKHFSTTLSFAVLWADIFLLPVGIVSTENGEKYTFVVQGKWANAPSGEPAPALPKINIPQEWLDDAQQSTKEPLMENEDEGEIPPQEETAPPEAVPSDPEQQDDPVGQHQVLPALPDTPVMEWPSVQVGNFVTVTTQTRAYLGVDDSVQGDSVGTLYIGSFIRDAAVQIESIEFLDSIKDDKLLHQIVHLTFVCSLRAGKTVGIDLVTVDEQDASLWITRQVQRVSDAAIATLPENEVMKVLPKQLARSKQA